MVEKTKISAPKPVSPEVRALSRLDKKMKEFKIGPKELYVRRLSPPNPNL